MPAARATRLRRAAIAFAVLALTAASAGPAAAAEPAGSTPHDAGPAWDQGTPASGGVIVRFRPGTTKVQKDVAADALGLRGGQRLRGIDGAVYQRDTTFARRGFPALPQVLSVTPDLRLQRDDDPTGEPLWGYLWGLDNTGQTVDGSSGTADVDIDGLEGQTIATGDPATVVAVIDDGVDFDHPDLAARAWTNPGESGPDDQGGDKATNGIDDDGNGYVDDVHGWDFCNDDNTVHDVDEDFHGTHVAGTIAASLDGEGMVGVAPNVSIMALKFIDNSKACGLTSMAIAAIAYAKSFGVVLANASWGGRGHLSDFLPLRDAIANSGLLFVTSAGNDAIDNDHDPKPAFPASFDLPNVVTVAAADADGNLAPFSNHGATTVDLFAPGVHILSAAPAPAGGAPGWVFRDGTSMAAPHVTGVAALLASQDPTLLLPANLATLKDRLMASGKVLPLAAGDTVSGRMVDARRALDSVAPTASAPNIQVLAVGSVMGATSVKASIGWPAGTDDMAGVRTYDLEQQVNGGAWTRVLTGTAGRSVARTLTFDATYRFRVRSRDRAGNVSPFMAGLVLTPKRFEETTSLATYNGTWSLASSTAASGGRTKYATRATASVTFQFTGRSFAVVVPKSTSRGSVRIYVDGVYAGPYSEYHNPTTSKTVLYSQGWAVNGAHTVRIVPVETAGRPRIDIDAFLVLR